MKIAIDIDGTIDASEQSKEFFYILTHLLIAEHQIYIITNREPGTEQGIAEELDCYGIDYNEIIITSEKAKYIKENQINILFENEDDFFLELGEEVLVFKIREEGNFSFAAKKWIGSKKPQK